MVTSIALHAPDITRFQATLHVAHDASARLVELHTRKWRMSFQSTTIRLRRLTLPSPRSLTSCARSFPRDRYSRPHVCNIRVYRVVSTNAWRKQSVTSRAFHRETIIRKSKSKSLLLGVDLTKLFFFDEWRRCSTNPIDRRVYHRNSLRREIFYRRCTR